MAKAFSGVTTDISSTKKRAFAPEYPFLLMGILPATLPLQISCQVSLDNSNATFIMDSKSRVDDSVLREMGSC